MQRATGRPAAKCTNPLAQIFNAKRNWSEPGFEQTNQHPVVCVSHADAVAYAAAGSFIDEGFAAGRAIFADRAARPIEVPRAAACPMHPAARQIMLGLGHRGVSTGAEQLVPQR